jgi:prepilin-type N-terminal cleavage/methylation domain-containing protein
MTGVRLKFARGFTIVELLITLMITSMLMVVIAGAINASAASYSVNDNIFKAVNTSRLVLLRITSEIRTAQAVAVGESDTQCSIITSDGTDITYSYDADADTLYLITNDDLGDDDYVMCENISDATFTKRAMPSDPGTVKDVKVSVTIDIGDFTQTVSSAAVIRNNLY